MNYILVKKAILEANKLIRKYDIAEAPVDLLKIVKGEGLSVVTGNPKEDSDLSGFISFDEKKVYINNKDSNERKSFTLAHELGHWVLHKEELQKNITMSRMYRKSYLKENNSFETEANVFASNVLVPEDLLSFYMPESRVVYYLKNTSKFDTDETPKLLADIFKVSKSMMYYRLVHYFRLKYMDLYGESLY